MDRKLLFEELIRRYEKKIRRAILAKFPNEMDADDLFQELAIHIYQKLEKEKDTELEKWDSISWIIRVTVNFCFSELRKRKTKKSKMLKDLPDTDAIDRKAYLHTNNHSYYDDPSRSVLEVDIDEVLSLLNERDRQLILLKLFEDKSTEEIDAQLGLTNSAVYYKRTITALQKKIGVDRFKQLYDDFFPAE